MRACFEGGSLGQGLPSVTPQLEERSAQCAEQQHFSSLREIATLFRFKHISLVIINKNNNYSAFFLIFRKEYFSFFLPSFCLSFFLSLNESPPPTHPSVCLPVCLWHGLCCVCTEVDVQSAFLCNAGPIGLSSEFSGRLFSHRWMCFCERAGMAVTSPGTAEKQTKPPAPLRKLAQAPPIGHKHYRVRSTK